MQQLVLLIGGSHPAASRGGDHLTRTTLPSGSGLHTGRSPSVGLTAPQHTAASPGGSRFAPRRQRAFESRHRLAQQILPSQRREPRQRHAPAAEQHAPHRAQSPANGVPVGRRVTQHGPQCHRQHAAPAEACCRCDGGELSVRHPTQFPEAMAGGRSPQRWRQGCRVLLWRT